MLLRFIAVFLFLLLLLSGCSSSNQGNVILIIVDTLRSDHLGCYDYSRDTSPSIDSLAENGVRYLNVTACEPWTLPSMVSIFTGLLPLEHNARRRGDSYYGIDNEITTLAEHLNRAGFKTAAFFNVIFMNADFGFHQGFDHFDCFSSLGSSSDRNAKQTVDAVFDWIDMDQPDKSLFLAVHFYDPHLTYSPPDSFADIWRDPDYSGNFDSSWGQREAVVNINTGATNLSPEDLYNLEALYDAEIAYTDHEIGRLLAGLRSRGLTENALVILVADHGEEFLDHEKFGHAHSLYQELLNVPLIISGPGFDSGAVSSINVSQTDILPTVLAWTAGDIPADIFGVNLLSPEFPLERSVPAGMNIEQKYVVTARRNDFKIHLFDGGSVSFMFDLDQDPGEHSYLDFVDSTLLIDAQNYLATPPFYHPAVVLVENVFLDALQNLGYI